MTGDRQEGWFYLTQGGVLLPTVELVIPKMVNPTTLKYGKDQISVGDVIWVISDHQRQLSGSMFHRVHTIHEEVETKRFVATLDGFEREAVFFDRGNQEIEWQVVPLEVTETKVSLKDQSLDFGSCRHFLAATADAGLKVGKVYAFAGFEKSTREGSHPCDIDMAFTYGNDTIPVIRQSRWAFPKGLVPVLTSWESEDKAFAFKRGDFIPYGGPNDPKYVLNPEDPLTVLCLIPHPPELPDLVCENGLRVKLSADGSLWKGGRPADKRLEVGSVSLEGILIRPRGLIMIPRFRPLGRLTASAILPRAGRGTFRSFSSSPFRSGTVQ